MNLLFSCVGRRGYLASWFREVLAPGDRIVGTTNTLWTPGLHACDMAVLMPDIADPAYLPTMLELCRSERIDGLLSFFDLDVDLIAPARDRFRAAGVTPIVPSAAVSRLSLDKLETARFLAAHGFDGPRTFSDVASAEAALRDGSVRLPMMVKPRHGYASRDVTEARTLEELRVFARREPDLLLQERLGGQEYSLDVLCDLDGDVVSVVVKRKHLMRAGETDQAETVEHPGALALGMRLGAALGALGHVGPLDVDLFIDGDRITVLELNPRFGGAYPVSHLAGAEFPGRIVRMLRGEPTEPGPGSYVRGVRMLKDYLILPAWSGVPLDLRHTATGA